MQAFCDILSQVVLPRSSSFLTSWLDLNLCWDGRNLLQLILIALTPSLFAVPVQILSKLQAVKMCLHFAHTDLPSHFQCDLSHLLVQHLILYYVVPEW